ncbi:hypothetical protein HNQ69_001196 [Bartonella callosciuri]|uniref:Uncharacterized protein n=1 Tax=Bartonella callosciuri TaxID=686223 RepID=A0A840NXL3_9HYPH|nr:hypothetical protein [Bartonella callosciuri]
MKQTLRLLSDLTLLGIVGHNLGTRPKFLYKGCRENSGADFTEIEKALFKM